MAKIAVLGVGAVGGTLATLLVHAGHEVTCVVREETVEEYRRSGLVLESDMFGHLHVYPVFVAEMAESPDMLIVTTKAFALSSALARVGSHCAGLVLPLLNGCEHLEVLTKRFGAECVVGGAVSIEAFRASQFTIKHTSPFVRLVMGTDTRRTFRKASHCALLFQKIGIAAEVAGSPEEVLWRKLVRLNALACITALSGTSIGLARATPLWRVRMEVLVDEGVLVSCAVGVESSRERVMAELEGLPPNLTSSLARDIAAGRPSELDAIAGGIVRTGQRFGIDCPAITEAIEELSVPVK